MSIPLGTSGVSSWGFNECNISGVTLKQLLEGSCVSIASYGLVMAKQGIGSSSSSIWYRNSGRSGSCIWANWSIWAGLYPCGDTHTNDAPEEDSYSLLGDLGYIVV